MTQAEILHQALLTRLSPAQAYLSVPTRPPAESWVRPPASTTVRQAFQILAAAGNTVELLTDYEGSSVGYTGDVEANLLSVAAVHPLREDAVQELLARAHADWSVVEGLLDRHELSEAVYDGHRFFMRRSNVT